MTIPCSKIIPDIPSIPGHQASNNLVFSGNKWRNNYLRCSTARNWGRDNKIVLQLHSFGLGVPSSTVDIDMIARTWEF